MVGFANLHICCDAQCAVSAQEVDNPGKGISDGCF